MYSRTSAASSRNEGDRSVGALGALNRVYINIGLYSEEWLRHFNPGLVGWEDKAGAIAVRLSENPKWDRGKSVLRIRVTIESAET